MSSSTLEQATRTVDGQSIPAAGTYEIDVAHSHVGFSAKHLMIAKVRGSFGAFSGSVTIAEEPTESSVAVSIDATSVDTRDAKRDGHLQSADFLDVENYPTLDYKSTSVRLGDDGDWVVDGELTVHGVTRNVPLAVTFEGAALDPWGGTRAVFSATAKVNREDFGLTWNQALETGGVLVGKDIVITIEAEAVKA